MVDDLEMLERLRDVDGLPAHVSERAKTVLRAAMTAEAGGRVTVLHRRPRRRVFAAAGLAGGIAAALAAVTLIPSSSGTPSRATAATGHVESPLVKLADYVSRSAAATGDATLVARTTDIDGRSTTVYDLYTDGGGYYFSPDEGGLAGQVRAGDDQGGAIFAREIAAAKQAAAGNVAAGAEAMAYAPDPGLSSGAVGFSPHGAPAGQQSPIRIDNWTWENSIDALVAGSGQPDVRAGVLQIIATLPDVTVTAGTLDGQPTQVLTAGDAELGPDYTEQLTIDATTGVPEEVTGGAPGQAPSVTVGYQVSRVSTSELPTGNS